MQSPKGYRDKFLLRIDKVRTGWLKFTEAIQDEWPHKGYCRAAIAVSPIRARQQ